jgi:DNA transformation protein
MTAPSPFVAHILEMMKTFGSVEPKAMFGGCGIYHQGVFFALVAQDVLYLKVDPESRGAFEALGLEPFVYESRLGQKTAMQYFQAPPEALESPEVMAEWARRSYEAALRAATARQPPRRRSAVTPRS